MSNQKTLKIDPESFKIGTKKKEKTNKIRLKPQASMKPIKILIK